MVNESPGALVTPSVRGLLVLFDGHALIHRAFHALPGLTVRRTGVMVNAVYGFASMVLKVMAELKPSHWAVAFDHPAPTFRDQLFAEYKSQRKPTPDELKSQFPIVHQLAEAFHLTAFEKEGYEADDLIAAVSTQASAKGLDTIIVTGDTDILQLVSPQVRVLAPRRTFSDTVLYGEAEVRQKYSLEPGQLADLKAFVGDTSDNVPGLKGVGEKTATRLLQEYGSIDSIYQKLETVQPERLRDLLRSGHTHLLESRRLVTVVRDVPVTIDLEVCRVSSYERERVRQLFQELEFSGLLNRLPASLGSPAAAMAPAPVPAPIGFTLVNTAGGLETLAGALKAADRLVINLETSGRNLVDHGLIGIGLAVDDTAGWYIPIGHQGLTQPAQLDAREVARALRPVLEDERIAKYSINAKTALGVMAELGSGLNGLQFDLTLAAHLAGDKALNLKSLAFNRLGVEIISPSEPSGSGRPLPAAQVPATDMARTASTGAALTLRLAGTLEKDLQRMELTNLFRDVEMPLIPILAAMERAGVALDLALLRDLGHQLGESMGKIEAGIYSDVGHPFNLNSPQQLSRVLYEELHLPAPRRKGGALSTEASLLEDLIPLHASVSKILEYRQLAKLKSTYLDALPLLVDGHTGRVHSNFNQAATATGRLSSSDPNLQNIPVRGDLGQKIRQAIVAGDGYVLLAADYSQIDLRVLAHLSRDERLLQAFLHDEDIHTATAAQVFSVGPAEVTTAMRRVAKTVNFGVIYGMSDYGLEQATDLTREEASRFIETYFQRYPGVKSYLEQTRELARRQGYVETVLGRRRYIPEITSPNRQVREGAERMAINMPVQGTSADIIKLAMIHVDSALRAGGNRSRLILQVHDELVFEAIPEEIDGLASLLKEKMAGALQLAVPLKIDLKQGHNWGELKKY
jgi:DNA polymerase-1